MKNKSIIFTEAYKAEVLEQPIPQPGPGQVLIRTMISTISSGTERANVTGEVNTSIYSRETKAVFPRQGGYSSSGIVEKIGEGVTKVKAGDKAALSWSVHAAYNCVPEEQVYKLEEGISFSEAALWHIATFPLAAIRKCRLETGESAIVMGQGILGQMAVKLLRAAGAVPIIAVDPVAEKRELAMKLGADYAMNPFADDFAQQVKAVTGGGAKVAIEVTGLGAGLDGVLDCMAPFGRVALLGCTRNSDFTIDYYHKVHGPGITLIGAHTAARPEKESYSGWWTTRDDALALQRLVKGGRLEFASMVEEMHRPEEAQEVYTRLASKASFPLVQFDWREEDCE